MVSFKGPQVQALFNPWLDAMTAGPILWLVHTVWALGRLACRPNPEKWIAKFWGRRTGVRASMAPFWSWFSELKLAHWDQGCTSTASKPNFGFSLTHAHATVMRERLFSIIMRFCAVRPGGPLYCKMRSISLVRKWVAQIVSFHKWKHCLKIIICKATLGESNLVFF